MSAAHHPRRRPVLPEGGDVTRNIGAFHPQAPIEDAIAALAEAQHLVFGVAQLAALGLSGNAVRKRLSIGRLHRIYRTVYSLVPQRMLTRRGRWMAAVLACGEASSLSIHAAGALSGLRQTARTYIDITVPGRTQRRHRGVRVHRSMTLTAADVTAVDGIPCTTIARTLFDMAGELTLRQVERAFDQAEAMEVLDLRAIDDQLERNSTAPAVGKIRTVLAEHRIGSTLTDSDLEEMMLGLLRQAGCPMPELQASIDPGDGDLMIAPRDFVWRRYKVDLETDGGRHRTMLQMRTDNRNDRRLRDAGWVVIRVGRQDLIEEPEAVIRSIILALRRAGAKW